MEYFSPSDFLYVVSPMPVIDVRSPSEFAAGHIADAINIPLLKDEERAIVGTIYKHKGKQPAIDKGMEFVEPKMTILAQEAQKVAKDGKVGLYCWRGGMRSNRTAWWFEENGIQCSVLEGGYKAFRNEALASFESLDTLLVIDGPTGSGKTDILHALKKVGEQVLDLEGMANHRGSVFGNIGLGKQPSSQQFQNDLFQQTRSFDLKKRIWIEREGMNIGKVYLPQSLWTRMTASSAIAIEVSQDLRVERLVNDYGSASNADLEMGIRKLQQRLGGQHMKAALELLDTNRLAEVAALLLNYYDKRYAFSKKKYLDRKPFTIELKSNDAAENAKLMIALANKHKL